MDFEMYLVPTLQSVFNVRFIVKQHCRLNLRLVRVRSRVGQGESDDEGRVFSNIEILSLAYLPCVSASHPGLRVDQKLSDDIEPD